MTAEEQIQEIFTNHTAGENIVPKIAALFATQNKKLEEARELANEINDMIDVNTNSDNLRRIKNKAMNFLNP